MPQELLSQWTQRALNSLINLRKKLCLLGSTANRVACARGFLKEPAD